MPAKSESKRRIGRVLEQIPGLMELNYSSREFKKWLRDAQVAITNTFGGDSTNYKAFDRIRYTPVMAFAGTDRSVYTDAHRRGLTNATAILESMIEEIDEYWPDDDPPHPIAEPQKVLEEQVSNRVFVVHGRDDGTKEYGCEIP